MFAWERGGALPRRLFPSPVLLRTKKRSERALCKCRNRVKACKPAYNGTFIHPCGCLREDVGLRRERGCSYTILAHPPRYVHRSMLFVRAPHLGIFARYFIFPCCVFIAKCTRRRREKAHGGDVDCRITKRSLPQKAMGKEKGGRNGICS